MNAATIALIATFAVLPLAAQNGGSGQAEAVKQAAIYLGASDAVKVDKLTDAEYQQLQDARTKAEDAKRELEALEEKLKAKRGATPPAYPCYGLSCFAVSVVVCEITKAEIRGRFVILETFPTGACDGSGWPRP